MEIKLLIGKILMIKLIKLILILNNGWNKLLFFKKLLKFKIKLINYKKLVIHYDY
jgi:hypothetical protein